MKIAHDHTPGFQVSVEGRGDDGFVGPPLPIDWQALRTRLFAAHDALGVLDPEEAASRLRIRGSFDGCAASVLTTYEGVSRPVNLDGSSNRKPEDGNDPPVAGVVGNGERG